MTLNFSDPIIDLGVAGLAGAFESGLVTPVQVTEAYLSRIERLNPALKAFLAVDRPRALVEAQASARRWVGGTPRSLIDGAPIGIKINIAVGGLPWHAGIGAYRDRIAKRDAQCVAALRRAGAVILGVLNMHEAGLGATNDNLAFGRCHNPYGFGLTPGGSSGGSASAVAAGLCAAALGTDTIGSVRIPASYCGVFGHKPTHGLVSTNGVEPLSWTLDDVGVLARSADDLSAVMQALAPLKAKVRSAQAASLRCAVIDVSDAVDLDDDVARAFEQTLDRATSAGWRLEPVRLHGWAAPTLRRISLLVVEVEALATHEAMLLKDPDGFSPALRGMLEWAAGQSAPKRARAYLDLAAIGESIRSNLSGFAAAILPTTPTPAFGIDGAPPADVADLTLLANISGVAATAFPIGLSPSGAPLSAQVLSRSNELAISLAGSLARASPAPIR